MRKLSDYAFSISTLAIVLFFLVSLDSWNPISAYRERLSNDNAIRPIVFPSTANDQLSCEIDSDNGKHIHNNNNNTCSNYSSPLWIIEQYWNDTYDGINSVASNNHKEDEQTRTTTTRRNNNDDFIDQKQQARQRRRIWGGGRQMKRKMMMRKQRQRRQKTRFLIWRRILFFRGGGGGSNNNNDGTNNDGQIAPPPPLSQRLSQFSQALNKQVKRGREKLFGEWEQRQRQFQHQIALISNSLIMREEQNVSLTKEEDDFHDQEAITPQSDMTRPGRHFTIVTTASLPWFTGTAINPLLRAAYLYRKTQQINAASDNGPCQYVTLVIPWLELQQDREALYGQNHVFDTPEQQEAYIRQWLREEAGMPDAADPETGLKIIFYPARYHEGLKSIFAMGDIVSLIPETDICLLEEPEHLNWFRAPGDGYTNKFNFVVGIVHTNYKEYASSQYHGLWTAPAIAMVSSAMVRAYCHKVIKLSPVLQTFAPEKEAISNTHGVRSDFLIEGDRRRRRKDAAANGSRKAYFIGKLLWAKGFDLMLDLQSYYKQCTGEYFAIDIYGSGPDEQEIKRAFLGRKSQEKLQLDSTRTTTRTTDDNQKENITDKNNETEPLSFEALQIKAKESISKIKQKIKETTDSLELDLPKTLHELRRQAIPATFPGRVDHALLTEEYSIFVNPSISEVLCTTTAEALAMNKWAIIPVHPSNTFFMQFPNCLAYRDRFEFAANLRWAMTHDPEPLKPELAHQFTWEAATERLIESSAITYREARERARLGRRKLDERIAWFHNEIGKGKRGDTIRKVLGGGPVSDQVRYQSQLDGSNDEEGFSVKLFGSSLSESIRKTLANGLPGLLPKPS